MTVLNHAQREGLTYSIARLVYELAWTNRELAQTDSQIKSNQRKLTVLTTERDKLGSLLVQQRETLKNLGA
jgi:hypothetical protein